MSATASSGLAVSFASTTTSVCTVSGTTVTLVAVGTCTIQATQAGNANYAAATPVNQSFQVTQGSQTHAAIARLYGVGNKLHCNGVDGRTMYVDWNDDSQQYRGYRIVLEDHDPLHQQGRGKCSGFVFRDLFSAAQQYEQFIGDLGMS